MYMTMHPSPVSMQETDGLFFPELRAVMKVSAGDLSADTIYEIKGLWNRFTSTAGSLEIVEDGTLPAHTACIGPVKAVLKEEDEYSIRVTTEGIGIAAKDTSSLLRAMMSLVQIVYPVSLEEGSEKLCVNCTEMHDHPAVPFRSMHICVFPETTLDALEKTIRMAGLAKFTHLCFEFWGTLRLDCLPELGWSNHSFTKQQLRPLFDLSRALGMEIIPMINHLGHATQSRGGKGRHTILDQNPRYALLFEPDGWTWCLSNPQTHTLLRKIREELMELCGPGSYFHLGCDESDGSYATCPLCRKKDPIEMLVNYLNGLCEELCAQGRRPMIWGDALLDREAWPSKYIATSQAFLKTHLALEKLDRRFIICDWQYGITEPELDTAEYFKKLGFDVLACPWDGHGNAKALSIAAEKLGLMGVMDTTWHHMNTMIPTIPTLGDYAWQGEAFEEVPAMYSQSAALLRKTVPHSGSFESSGWLPQEVSPIAPHSV